MSEQECQHRWVANSGQAGEPDFRINRMMGPVPTMHVKCSECGCRTWISKATWEAFVLMANNEVKE